MAHATILICIAILVIAPSTLSQKSHKSGTKNDAEEAENFKKQYAKIRCLVNPRLCGQPLKGGKRELETFMGSEKVLKRSKRECLSGLPISHCEEQMRPKDPNLRPEDDPKYTGPKMSQSNDKSSDTKSKNRKRTTEKMVDDWIHT